MNKIYADFDIEHGYTNDGWWCSITAHATNSRAITLVITDDDYASAQEAEAAAKALLIDRISKL